MSPRKEESVILYLEEDTQVTEKDYTLASAARSAYYGYIQRKRPEEFQDIPQFSELPEDIKNAWATAAEAVREELGRKGQPRVSQRGNQSGSQL